MQENFDKLSIQSIQQYAFLNDDQNFDTKNHKQNVPKRITRNFLQNKQ